MILNSKLWEPSSSTWFKVCVGSCCAIALQIFFAAQRKLLKPCRQTRASLWMFRAVCDVVARTFAPVDQSAVRCEDVSSGLLCRCKNLRACRQIRASMRGCLDLFAMSMQKRRACRQLFDTFDHVSNSRVQGFAQIEDH